MNGKEKINNEIIKTGGRKDVSRLSRRNANKNELFMA